MNTETLNAVTAIHSQILNEIKENQNIADHLAVVLAVAKNGWQVDEVRIEKEANSRALAQVETAQTALATEQREHVTDNSTNEVEKTELKNTLRSMSVVFDAEVATHANDIEHRDKLIAILQDNTSTLIEKHAVEITALTAQVLSLQSPVVDTPPVV